MQGSHACEQVEVPRTMAHGRTLLEDHLLHARLAPAGTEHAKLSSCVVLQELLCRHVTGANPHKRAKLSPLLVLLVQAPGWRPLH